jgi:phosphate uptake regulator
MELRKVQRTPGGTFFVCLPKSWAEQHGLIRGSVVAISESPDGRLCIDAAYKTKPSPQTVVIQPTRHLDREIVGKYLLGYDIIRIEAKDRIGFDVRETVKHTARQLIGLEIIEEDYASIVLQCLLEPSGFPPEKILRREYAIVAGMHRDVVNALIDGDISLAKSVLARDDEVNRLYFLLVRVLRTVVQNPSLGVRLGVRPIECLDFRLASNLVETMGDECVHIATKTIELKGKKFSQQVAKIFLDFDSLVSKARENALKSFLMGDIALAEAVKDMRGKIDKTFEGVEHAIKAETVNLVACSLAAASALRQIYEHSVDIADLAMPKTFKQKR